MQEEDVNDHSRLIRAKSESRRKHIRIAVMGYHKVGKTSIIRQFPQARYQHIVETAENDAVMFNDTYSIKLGNTVLDLIEFKSPKHCINYPAAPTTTDMMALFSKVDAFILVFAVDDEVSYTYIESLKEVILETKADDAPIVVVGNKRDSTHRELNYEITDCIICIDWDMKYVEVSATTPSNIEAILHSLFKDRSFMNHLKHPTPVCALRYFRRKSSPFIFSGQDIPEDGSRGRSKSCSVRHVTSTADIAAYPNIEPAAEGKTRRMSLTRLLSCGDSGSNSTESLVDEYARITIDPVVSKSRMSANSTTTMDEDEDTIYLVSKSGCKVINTEAVQAIHRTRSIGKNKKRAKTVTKRRMSLGGNEPSESNQTWFGGIRRYFKK